MKKTIQEHALALADAIDRGTVALENLEPGQVAWMFRKLASRRQVAWLTDRDTMYFDKEDARRDSDGFIQPLFVDDAK